MKKINLDGLEVIIREAAKEDAKAVIDYIDKISYESDFLTFGPGEFTMTQEKEEAFIVESLNSKNKLFLIAEINNKIVGNLNFQGNEMVRCKHIGEFGVSVLKDYWGKGIGRELLLYLIDWAKKSSFTKIQLSVREDNLSAIMLYEKLGFKKEGSISRFFYHNKVYHSAIIMGIELNNDI
ncbi:GNAT family N-acetyltransferase [Serpentinicella alkaliphila]|uniref:RimJ/RimL family protein N-acetyltransferase n=1 Tax=Serpentinicella alkaliphila TaxID=1734049 RepID=A0A4R2TNC7_9FIRM|nr:GNAT family N-acetyltransferase [Serpentinicella alkaliphila]QUH26546.1 GNAT family N-acetyltransferase [Serpentinicella alkaliphila]TCP96452.1 RimJ/RimL family protein N-acetyltransferase [Serpentinicella alkaliphila]